MGMRSPMLLVVYLFLCSSMASSQIAVGSSTFFRVCGNVYPFGAYYAALEIVNPPKTYYFDIDTGSPMTWVQCDAPCLGCTLAVGEQYKPNNNSIVSCMDPICLSDGDYGYQCIPDPIDRCTYNINYLDGTAAQVSLVRDEFLIQLMNGSTLAVELVFGCGDNLAYAQKPPHPIGGIVGLMNGKYSILSQLIELGVTRNVLGHCLDYQGGYFFFGDDFIPTFGVSYVPQDLEDDAYSFGPAEIYLAGKPTKVKVSNVVFDSGITYTYFPSKVYKAILEMVQKSIKGKPLEKVRRGNPLSVCWKGEKDFKTVQDANDLFPSLALSFTEAQNTRFELPPEAYLIVTELGNVCFGILDGGYKYDLHYRIIIGAISLRGKLVSYDMEANRIGWSAASCDRLPNYNISSSSPSFSFAPSLSTYTYIRTIICVLIIVITLQALSTP